MWAVGFISNALPSGWKRDAAESSEGSARKKARGILEIEAVGIGESGDLASMGKSSQH